MPGTVKQNLNDSGIIEEGKPQVEDAELTNHKIGMITEILTSMST